MEPTSGWTRVVATCATASAEIVADRLWAFGPAAIEEQTSGPDTVLLAGFDDAEVAEQAAAVVRLLGCRSVDVVAVTDDGLDGWRDWASVEAAGPFVLVPAWLDGPDVDADHLLLRLDPGHTFGSGSHPTTRAVLMALAERVGTTTAVLDVGCGSGVLSVAAAMLGAPRVHGIDVDVASPSVVAANAAVNHVAHVVAVSNEPLSAVAQRNDRYDVVAANLLAPVIAELAADLQAVVADGGTLILSGLLADRWQQTVDRFTDPAAAAGDAGPTGPAWVVDDVIVLEGWAAVVLRRP